MKKLYLLSVLLLTVLLIVGCEKDQVLAPQSETAVSEGLATLENAEAVAMEMIALSGWSEDSETEGFPPSQNSLGKSLPGSVISCEREHISGDIYHYSYVVRVGDGQYDVIGLHRVVRERRPNKPIHTQKSIFMQHGSSKDFIGMWLPGLTSPATPDDFGMGVYLASHDIDVWGIDQSWTLVPASVTNTGFMIDWGLDRQLGDLRTAVAIARRVRILTGSGAAKMILAGYSNGISTTVSLVNEESQLPPGKRDVGGYIPIDMPIKAEPGPLQETMGFYSEYYYSLYTGGLYAETVIFAPMAELVRCCPNDPSPYDPGMTNVEYALMMSAGAVFFPPTLFHYWAGILQNGIPTGLRFVDWDLWLDFLASGTAYEPIIWTVDWTGYVAGTLNTPYDDHLADIEVPILNITPGGGFAEATFYGLSLLGSADIETLMPSMGLPPEEDYAHIDIFTYPGSEQLVWQPMLQWIIEHTPGN